MTTMDVMAYIGRVAEALDAALEIRDIATHSHSNRVITLASHLGNACGLDALQLHHLEVCARFHDIGKIGIPDSILQKKGRLTRDEYEVIKQHSTIGGSLIRRITVPGFNHFATVIEHHHERFDGKGYPAGLRGEKIPLLSRIISIVDSFDAITSKRSYREAHTVEFALEIIARESGSQFDPELSSLFLQLVDEDATNSDTLFTPSFSTP